MEKICNKILEILKDNKPVMLVTIVESKGSMPRKEGAVMLADESGRIAGTIGGGYMEYMALQTVKDEIANQKSFIKEYHLDSNDAAKIGMICGGSGKVLFYYLDFSKIKMAEEWVQKFNNHIAFDIEMNCDGGCYKFSIKPDGYVYIFGAGHLARELVPVLSHLNFECIVVDDREEFADAKFFPDAKKVLCTDFKHLESFISLKQNDYAAIMSRGHMSDLDIERFCLKSEAKYIGVVGSRRKTKFLRSQLLEEGYSETNVNRIISPIGLDIQSETPAEIAISIAAQLIQIRANYNK